MAACERATDWCSGHEGDNVSITFRRARRGEAAGTYRVCPGGSLQIYGYTLPVPAVIRDLTDRAWEHACETWPTESDD